MSLIQKLLVRILLNLLNGGLFGLMPYKKQLTENLLVSSKGELLLLNFLNLKE
jgi:hypothetical protein